MKKNQTSGTIGNGNTIQGFGMVMVIKYGSNMVVRLTNNVQSVKASVHTNFGENLYQGDTWELEITRDKNDNIVATLIKNGTISYSTNTLYTNLRNTSICQTFTFADVGGFFINWYGQYLTTTKDIEVEMVQI